MTRGPNGCVHGPYFSVHNVRQCRGLSFTNYIAESGMWLGSLKLDLAHGQRCLCKVGLM